MAVSKRIRYEALRRDNDAHWYDSIALVDDVIDRRYDTAQYQTLVWVS